MISAGLYLVRDPADRREHLDHLRGLASQPAGPVLAEPRPGSRGMQWVAAAILEGLGKDLDAGPGTRSAGRMWLRTLDWLIAFEVSDLIVTRAQEVRVDEWRLLVEAATEADLRLWLIVQQENLRRGEREFIAAWPFAELDWEEFETRWPALDQTPTSAEVEQAEQDFPRVPDDDFISFWASAEALLSAEQFVLVERAFDAGMDCHSSLDNGESWQSTIRGIVEGSGSVDEAVARIRGAQATLFLAGSWLRLDSQKFRLAWEAREQAAMTPALAASLSRYQLPQWTALGAVRAVTHAGPTELAELRIGDVDGGVISVNGRRHEVPIYARPLIRAQVAARARDGGIPEDPLFHSDCGAIKPRVEPAPLTAAGTQRLLRQLGNQLGVTLIERKASRAVEDDAKWGQRRGLSLRSLENGGG